MEENTKNIDAMNKERVELELCKCHLESELKAAISENTLLDSRVIELEAKEKRQTQTIAKLEDKLFK